MTAAVRAEAEGAPDAGATIVPAGTVAEPEAKAVPAGEKKD